MRTRPHRHPRDRSDRLRREGATHPALALGSAAPMSTLAIGFPGLPEMLVIGGVLIVLFGAKKLPELARAMGSSITQFKKGLHEEESLGKLPSGGTPADARGEDRKE